MASYILTTKQQREELRELFPYKKSSITYALNFKVNSPLARALRCWAVNRLHARLVIEDKNLIN